MKKVTTTVLKTMKQQGQKITAITAYDVSFSQLFDEQGIDVILIGDSLGMVLQGHNDTLPVSIEDMAYHTRAVRAGAKRSLVIADMPFMSYATPEQTYINAGKLMKAGASMVKLEGGVWLADVVRGLNERGVPVCGHIGLTPQSVHVFGGFKIQGRSGEQADKIVAEAIALEAAGVHCIVVECVPSALAQRITEAVSIPIIGIGAGVHTDGQILVMHDMLGISANYMPKFSKNYLAETGDIRKAVALYIEEVQAGRFPEPQHCFE